MIVLRLTRARLRRMACMSALGCGWSMSAQALTVDLTFQVPELGAVTAAFIGYDNNMDGQIRSADAEVAYAWSSVTGGWPDASGYYDLVVENVDLNYQFDLSAPQGLRTHLDTFALGLVMSAPQWTDQSILRYEADGTIWPGHTLYKIEFARARWQFDPAGPPPVMVSDFSTKQQFRDEDLYLKSLVTSSALTVPEPATAWLVVAGIGALVGTRRRHRPGAGGPIARASA